jgi:hypothetical protein
VYDFLKIIYSTIIIPATPVSRNHLESGSNVSKKNIALPNTEKSKLATAILSSLTK